MVRIVSALVAAVSVGLLCIFEQAKAQRIQFPSSVPATTVQQPITPSTGSPTYNSAPPPSTALPYASQPSAVTPTTPSWDPYGTGPVGAAPPQAGPYSTSTPQPMLDPAYGNAHTTPTYPQQPGALFPDGAPFGWQPGTYVYQGPDGSVSRLQRFLQNVGFEYTWLAALKDDEEKFEVNKVELWSTFGVPFLYNTETPLRVTPGFAVHYLEGPITAPPRNADLPPRLFDAYLDAAWEPRVTEWLSGDLGLRVGVYSDFKHVNDEAVRLMGRGLGVLQFTPTVSIAAGVWYLDRNKVKLLPAGGVIWTPSPDTNFRILFPNPKLAHRFTTVGTSEWWWYFTGEYGGGAWSLERAPAMPGGGARPEQIDYNDVRLAFGLEWIGQRGLRGHIEVGYVWDREIIFARTMQPDSFKPNDTLMLRGGLDY